uniref:T-complex protein 1 subunit theta n=1 Tax=Plectus sambesii TaxID=2011161 RepID=A0A914UZM2_9BILA
MAMSIPKTGMGRFMKDGTRHYKGVEEAVHRNIEACVALAATTRSSYGPNGMNKMVINHLEKLFVTNDAATILKELEIEHPAARMLVLASQMQEKEIGDGTNTVIILAASMLEHAGELLNMGLSPAEVAEGLEKAAEKALEILPSLVVEKVEDLHDVAKVTRVLRPIVMSKQYGNEDFVAEMIAKACVQILPKNNSNFNVDNIRICKIIGSGVLASRAMNGMVFRRGAEGEIKKVANSKIAVFTCAFDLTQTETKGTVLINNADELMNFSKGEESEVEAQVKALADSGVNVVVAGGKFGDLYLHFLNKYHIMGVRLTSKFDLRRLTRSIGAQAQARILAPKADLLGHCDEVYTEEIGDTEVVVFKQNSEHGQVATIVIRGSSESLMDDLERAVDDAVNTFKALTKDNRLVPGAGAVEIELARQIESYGERCAGLDQYSIKKFAHSLEALPKQLADNAGVKTTEVLSKLYAAHQQGQANAGFDVEEGGVKDVVAAGIFDLFSAKWWAIKLATDAATTVLKVDQIIVSKLAEGPKPRAARPQDEDDDGGMA